MNSCLIAGPRWVGAWSIAHTDMTRVPSWFDNQTFRTVMQVNPPGERVRIRVSNRYGRKPVQIGGAAVSLCGESGALTGSSLPILFGGIPWRTLDPGEDLTSDPVDLAVPQGSWLAVDLYYPGKGRFLSGNLFPILHRVSETGLHAGEEPFPGRKRFLVRRLASRALPVPVGILAGVELLAPETSRAIVAFGDSITVFNQWTSVLANRFLIEKPGCLSLLNQGISGNRLLHDSGFALTGGVYGPAGILRFKQDVLTQSGIAAIISLIGINDLLQPGLTAPRDQEQDADGLVDGMRGLIHMAHENGIHIIGGTITPFGGYLMSHTPEREAVRQAVNSWIREDGEFDGFIDFDAAIRDPVNPERLMDGWHIGDHLHPNALGGKIMASVIQTEVLDECI
jgi:lysophospholipase L1-like esterase